MLCWHSAAFAFNIVHRGQGKWFVLGGCDHARGGTALCLAVEPGVGDHGQPDRVLPTRGTSRWTGIMF